MSLSSQLTKLRTAIGFGPPPSAAMAMGNARARRLMRNYTDGDWPRVETFMAGIADWHDRSFFLRLMAAHTAFAGWLSDGSNVSPLARLLLGMHLERAAWRARGSGTAEMISEARWQEYFRLLNEAEDALATACELLPADPQPWASRIAVGYGLELSKETTLLQLGEAAARAPGFRPAYASAVVGLSQQWGGSHLLMFETAREAQRTLPPGSPGRVAIPRAHFLRRRFHAVLEKDEQKANAYYADPAVADEVVEAARASVLSPAFVANLDSPWPLADFALVLCLCHEAGRPVAADAAAVLKLLGSRLPPATLWSDHFGAKAEAEFNRLRQQLLRAAGTAEAPGRVRP